MTGSGVRSWRQCEPGGQALWHENWHRAEVRSSHEAMSQRDKHTVELRKEARGQPDGSSTGPQVRGTGNMSRAMTRDNQDQVGKGSGLQERLRHMFQDTV